MPERPVKRSKLSAALICMAETVLKDPSKGVPSEAAQAALLLAHVAWNREVAGDSFLADRGYLPMLAELEESNQSFEQYLKSTDWEALITGLREFRRNHYPHDNRFITSCGFNERGNVEVVSHDYLGKVKMGDMTNQWN